jgi:aryl-alcohol dehydrogenase-like predicted oxidoreductase
MQYRKLGTSDLNVSQICLGTMTFGKQNSEAEAHQQLDYAVSRGINFIDCAEMYPVPTTAEDYGRSETLLGTWLVRQPRDKLLIATKATGAGRRMNWIRGGQLAFDRKGLTAAVDASLKRLQTDTIDLYQLHWPERNTPIFGGYHFDQTQERAFTPLRETLDVLADLVRAGKLRYVGLSNETPWGVMEFLRLADAHDLPRVVSVQNAYHLLNRNWEHGLAEIGFRENVALLSYSPLAFGNLTGKYLDDPAAPGRVNTFPGFNQRYSKPNVPNAVAAYVALARQHGLTPTELALAFVYSRRFVTSAIVGATSVAQLKQNIDAVDTKLSDEIVAEVEQLHLRYPNPAP